MLPVSISDSSYPVNPDWNREILLFTEMTAILESSRWRVGTKQGQEDPFQSGCSLVHHSSFPSSCVRVRKVCKLASCCPQSVWLRQQPNERSPPAGVVPAPPCGSSLPSGMACSELYWLTSARAFIPCFAHSCAHYRSHLSLETQILEVLALPRFLIAFSLKTIQCLVWEFSFWLLIKKNFSLYMKEYIIVFYKLRKMFQI